MHFSKYHEASPAHYKHRLDGLFLLGLLGAASVALWEPLWTLAILPLEHILLVVWTVTQWTTLALVGASLVFLLVSICFLESRIGSLQEQDEKSIHSAATPVVSHVQEKDNEAKDEQQHVRAGGWWKSGWSSFFDDLDIPY